MNLLCSKCRYFTPPLFPPPPSFLSPTSDSIKGVLLGKREREGEDTDHCRTGGCGSDVNTVRTQGTISHTKLSPSSETSSTRRLYEE
ncbi:hypothetical protein DPEC_G00026010 [Dallia pectoralis]|uniref:Uncharacterized protein n=1 Tax=Dallia pectoralis TaxID=75939 RepID=A0ACC2HIW8_DALPE|nr:hypothetical protein DPEC_G00026010 [Dallia pectoralis]